MDHCPEQAAFTDCSLPTVRRRVAAGPKLAPRCAKTPVSRGRSARHLPPLADAGLVGEGASAVGAVPAEGLHGGTRRGGSTAARGRPEHLLTMSGSPHGLVRVLPFAVGALPGAGRTVVCGEGPVRRLDTVRIDSTHARPGIRPPRSTGVQVPGSTRPDGAARPVAHGFPRLRPGHRQPAVRRHRRARHRPGRTVPRRGGRLLPPRYRSGRQRLHRRSRLRGATTSPTAGTPCGA